MPPIFPKGCRLLYDSNTKICLIRNALGKSVAKLMFQKNKFEVGGEFAQSQVLLSNTGVPEFFGQTNH